MSQTTPSAPVKEAAPDTEDTTAEQPVASIDSSPISTDGATSLSKSPLARALAEFAGTFLICFAIYTVSTYGTVLYGINILLIAVLTGAAYAAATAVFSRFSGAHFNPAVTLAAVLTSRISWLDALLYLVAQVLGGIAAGAVAIAILPTTETVTAKAWLTYTINGFDTTSLSYLANSTLQQAGLSFGSTMAIVVEVVMSLLVVAAAIVTMREDGSALPNRTTAIGFAYGVAVAVAYPITGAGLNPVRSTGIALFAQGKGLTVEPLSQLWLFWICPLLAGAVVALVMLLSSTFSEMIAKNAMARTAAAGLDVAESTENGEAVAADAGQREAADIETVSDGTSASEPVQTESTESESADAESVTGKSEAVK
ncbi:MIP/aquaporin family protein [Bifidobacterium vansinderenii]|uniref:Major intrinsic protein n=1 Tax=Bifidobacterium vansinderenii TaxID=1984871 RepID=A0A229W0E9_9BIFI|nr:aquaporin [Bifidobacterium vansinderenii]OXN01325.1 major intrinsic protein [Bifidobacterium vansinderenii]